MSRNGSFLVEGLMIFQSSEERCQTHYIRYVNERKRNIKKGKNLVSCLAKTLIFALFL